MLLYMGLPLNKDCLVAMLIWQRVSIWLASGSHSQQIHVENDVENKCPWENSC